MAEITASKALCGAGFGYVDSFDLSWKNHHMEMIVGTNDCGTRYSNFKFTSSITLDYQTLEGSTKQTYGEI